MYPITQIPPDKKELPAFVWFDYIRPRDKYDIFNWRGKAKGTELRNIERRAAPLQFIGNGGVVTGEAPAAPPVAPPEQAAVTEKAAAEQPQEAAAGKTED